MKFIFSMMIVMCTLSTQTFAATGSGLKEAFAEFRYQTQVEWDQNDPAFMEKASDKLNLAVEKAMEQGASKEEVLQEALSLVANETLKKDIQEIMSLSSLRSPSETRELLLTAIKSGGNNGASWAPLRRFLETVFGITAFIGVMMIAAYFDAFTPTCRITSYCEENIYGDVYCTERCR